MIAMRFYSVCAFLVAPLTSSFMPHLPLPQKIRKPLFIMMAEAPKYDKRPALVQCNTQVGRKSHLIKVKSTDALPVDYRAGHVIALEVPHPSPEKEGEWMRGPYTITRASEDEGTLEVIYRLVGEKSETMSELKSADKVRFGGKFHVPIIEGIDAEHVDRVVGISTGVGIGPLLGFAEEALSSQDVNYKVDLYVAFREEEDICCRDVLDGLVKAHPAKFSWTPILSSVQGYISAPENLKKIVQDGEGTSAGATHYHLVGNGAMVNEFQAGLQEAGVLEERVTVERYFNHKVNAREEVVKVIASELNEGVAVL